MSIPKRCRKSIVRVLYKGKGDAEDPNSYRGIALECATFINPDQIVNQKTY